MKRLYLFLNALVLGLSLAASASADNHQATDEAPESKPVPEPMHFVTDGSVRIDGQKIDYTATAGTLLIKDNDGEPQALFGYTAYVRKGADRHTRPLLFAYNGGPGSASMWLHMGILGPKRTDVEDVSFTTTGPFRYVDNEASILDKADLVMIDPVGTGFSRPVGEAEGKDFWGVDQDIASVSSFIVRYVTETGRWTSPKYLLGESYGGIRSGGVAYRLLTTHNLALNGVILVSPYMDFVAGNADASHDLPYVNYITTYAATAWYHGAIEDRPDDLQAFLSEADAFARGEYATALMLGNRATAEQRASVLAGLERFTGISRDYWDRANLRINEQRFSKELLRDERTTVGRIDSRFKGPGINHIKETFSYDPFFPAVGPAFYATFNDYYREVLGVETDMTYIPSGGQALGGVVNWDWKHKSPGKAGYLGSSIVPNTAVDLNYAMVQNPKMRLLVQQGYYDLATPFGATDYFLDHLDAPAEVLDNVTVEYYEAGHMMYLHPESRAKFKRDLAAFID